MLQNHNTTKLCKFSGNCERPINSAKPALWTGALLQTAQNENLEFRFCNAWTPLCPCQSAQIQYTAIILCGFVCTCIRPQNWNYHAISLIPLVNSKRTIAIRNTISLKIQHIKISTCKSSAKRQPVPVQAILKSKLNKTSSKQKKKTATTKVQTNKKTKPKTKSGKISNLFPTFISEEK